MMKRSRENPGSTAAATGWRRRRGPAAISSAPGTRRIAGWLRAMLADDRGAALRADLDRLVTKAIIPERAAKAAARSDLLARIDPKEAQGVMTAEWEAFKKAWSK